MSEDKGGSRPPPQQKPTLSYAERMRRVMARNEAQRAQMGFGTGGYATSAVSNPSISTTATTTEEKENAANGSHYDTSLLQESQLRVNKSAPAGDVSSMGASMLSTMSGGDELQRSTFSVLGESNVSRNTSGGSSGVIDMPREAAGGHHNSILTSFIKEEEEGQPCRLESFSRPPMPAPRTRVNSVEARVDEESFQMDPPPVAHQQQQQHHHSLLQQPSDPRYGRTTAANGSILRSKSAAGFEPMFATPAVSRSTAILAGLQPRTPGFCQTPSMHRLSLSALSLNSVQRMMVQDKEYAILNQIGKGGSSQVYQAFDDISGATVAIKVVDLKDTDDASREAFINEVELLKKLQGSRHVIKMFDYEMVPEEDQLLVVMEKGETDLATFLKTRRIEITPSFLKYWWEEMLQAVAFVHEHKVVHMDLKPANFLLVSGNLKLIDFGIASSIPSDKTSLLKETQMGTLSYMSPESLMAAEMEDEETDCKFKVTAKSDVWSLGCILYTMVYGRKPFDQFKNARSKMKAIADPNTTVDYRGTMIVKDPMIIDVLKRCLVHDVKRRASVAELLAHPYLKTQAADKSAAATATPVRASPISDDALQRLAVKLQSFTPRTTARELKKLVQTAQANNRPAPKLDLDHLPDSPPSTK